MIACIILGNSTIVQGDYISPGVVRVDGKLYRGVMIGSVR